ncbi:MAG: DUF7844 domain-containing protein [Pseudobdellovibrionaceae bacterium]
MKGIQYLVTLFSISLVFIFESVGVAQTIQFDKAIQSQSKLLEYSKELIEDAKKFLPPNILKALQHQQINFQLSHESMVAGTHSAGTISINADLLIGSAGSLGNEDVQEWSKKVWGVPVKTHHKTVRELAIAAVLHELIHFVDQTPDTFAALQLEPQTGICQSAISTARPDQCDKVGNISGLYGFLRTFDWENGKLGLQNRNYLDALFFGEEVRYSPKETLAINMEYFLLDPSYKCRMPSKYQWLSSFFKYSPFLEQTCGDQNYFFLSGSSLLNTSRNKMTLMKVNPERLYQIHFMWAGAGSEVISQFGHAMLRLVFCAPDTVYGPECLKDLSYHVAINFAAAIDEGSINIFKGLANKYPSLVSADQLLSTVGSYTQTEFRPVYSVPLSITHDEMQNLYKSILENHWSYENRYAFFSNNCAVEALRILKRGLLLHSEILELNTIRPDSLFEFLLKKHSDLFADLKKAEEAGYYFSSQKNILDTLFYQVRDLTTIFPSDMTFDEFMKLPAQQRHDYYTASGILKTRPVEYEDIKRKLLALEKALAVSQVQNIKQQALNKLLETHDKSYEEILGYLFSLRSPAYLYGAKTYGIPLGTEIKELLKSQQLNELKEQMTSKYNNAISFGKNIIEPELQRELEVIKENEMLLKKSLFSNFKKAQ